MLTWHEFAQTRPDLATAGRELLYQFGVGLAFLGTVRLDGGPRMHPIAPILTDDCLFGFIEPSPKLRDLLRDGRYALHSHPRPSDEDAFYVTGRVQVIEDTGRLETIHEGWRAQRGSLPLNVGEVTIVEFLIESAMLTRTTGHGDFNPQHTVWRI